jgi:hypothetical protein
MRTGKTKRDQRMSAAKMSRNDAIGFAELSAVIAMCAKLMATVSDMMHECGSRREKLELTRRAVNLYEASNRALAWAKELKEEVRK